jgi:hypothetical protein
MFWKSKAKETPVHERAFSLTLPGAWVAEPSSDPTRWSYHTNEGHESLTVSLIGGSTTRLSRDEQSRTIERMVEISRRVQTKVPGITAITMTDATYGESEGVLAARYGGIEPARQRRFHCLLLSSPVAVTSFYYEAVGLTDADSEARARTIMNSIVVPR